MARSLWSGSISFGLVTIPVRMFTAEHEHEVHFHQLNRNNGHRIRYKKVDDATGEEVESDDIVKGYEVSKGEWVTFDDDELEQLRPESTRTLDIEDFVDLAEVDPIYYDKTYFLAPEDNVAARRAYALLLEAMEDRQRVGIGKVVIRAKQYLAAIRPYEGILAMSTMRFADEVVDPARIEDLDFDVAQVDAKSKKMAASLIDSLSSAFDPAKYEDTHNAEVRALIDAKAKGETLSPPDAKPDVPEVIDLMAALQASVEAARANRGGPRSSTTRAASTKGAGKKAPAKKAGAKKGPASKTAAKKPAAKKASSTRKKSARAA
jgi:DNA end-binding protein Ku